MKVNLRELLKTDFDLDFPISGGVGNSIDDPIIIHRSEPNDPVGVEHGILRCLSAGRRLGMQVIGQELMDHNGKRIDRLRVLITPSNADEEDTWVERYYFDITETWG